MNQNIGQRLRSIKGLTFKDGFLEATYSQKTVKESANVIDGGRRFQRVGAETAKVQSSFDLQVFAGDGLKAKI